MWKNVHKSRPGHGQGFESAAILLSLPPWVVLDERDMSIAPVLNSRLHNPPTPDVFVCPNRWSTPGAGKYHQAARQSDVATTSSFVDTREKCLSPM